MSQASDILPQLFRTEYSNIVAVLCQKFGLKNIQLAQDIVSDTFLLATETWGLKGIPKHQRAWLYKVAQNRTIDHIRRHRTYADKVSPHLQNQYSSDSNIIEFEDEIIKDSTLRMMFAICNADLNDKSKIILSLRILCGFGIAEIASAMLSNKEAISKRLLRAKEKIRAQHLSLDDPIGTQPKQIDTVLKTIYLLFNEGYHSTTRDDQLRKDLCLESLRLSILLSISPIENKQETYALISLICFHASRFQSRISPTGEIILLAGQNSAEWDQGIIKKGTLYLNKSAFGDHLSKYHLEAAIAYWHTKQESKVKWTTILKYYDLLLHLKKDPMVAISRTYAYSKVNGVNKGIEEAHKLRLQQYHYYFFLLGELYKGVDQDKSISYFKKGMSHVKNKTELDIIKKRIKQLESNHHE